MYALDCNIALIILTFVNGASAANYRCEKTPQSTIMGNHSDFILLSERGTNYVVYHFTILSLDLCREVISRLG